MKQPGIAKLKASACISALLTLSSLFLFAGFIGHKMSQSDLGPVQTATCCPCTADCSPFQRRLQTDRLDLNTTCVLRPSQELGANTCWSTNGLNWRLSSVELLQTSWYSKAFICHFFMMKRWWFVYFAGSQTESVPILRMRMVEGEDGTFLFLHGDCFPAMFSLFFLNWTWSFFAFVGTVLFHRWHLNDLLCRFARGIKIFTTAYAVVGSWILRQNVLKA